jgi:hypothetical protein
MSSERKLSFNFWRYRLLHWAFNVKDADINRPQDTGLPKFLYTHYCPLWNLTNLIAILSPLILAIKVTYVLCVSFVSATSWAWSQIPWLKLMSLIEKMIPEKKEKAESKASQVTIEQEKQQFVSVCRDWIIDAGHNLESFPSLWSHCESKFVHLNSETAEEMFKKYAPKIVEARERAIKRKEKMQERIVFWTNFSQVFIKGALNVFYVGICLGVLYLLYLLAGPAWDALCAIADGIVWIFSNTGSLSILFFALKIILWAVAFAAAIYGLARMGWIQKFFETAGTGVKKLSPPFYLVGKLFGWVVGGFVAVAEFVSMFYEQNCPPIVLVSPEDEIIEKVAEGEE